MRALPVGVTPTGSMCFRSLRRVRYDYDYKHDAAYGRVRATGAGQGAVKVVVRVHERRMCPKPGGQSSVHAQALPVATWTYIC